MRRVALFPIILGMALVGCSKPEAPFVGRWQFAADAQKTGDTQKDAAMEKIAQGFFIVMNADKTATVTMFAQAIPATFSVSGKVATLTLAPIPGAPASASNKPLTLTLSDDGKALTSKPDGATKITKFVKVPN